METEIFNQQTFKQPFSKVLDSLKDPNHVLEGESFKVIASLVKNTDFFQKNFESPMKLDEFFEHAKEKLKYETHPYGSILLREKAYAEKFYVILSGSVEKLHQRSQNEVEKDLKRERYHALRDFKGHQILPNPVPPKNDEQVKSKSKETFHHTHSAKKIFTDINFDFKRREGQVIGSEASLTLLHQSIGFIPKNRKTSLQISEEEPQTTADIEDNEFNIKESPSPSHKAKFLKSRSSTNVIKPKGAGKSNPSSCVDISAVNNLIEFFPKCGTLNEIKEEDGATPLHTNGQKDLIRDVVSKNPELRDRCFVGNTAKVCSTQFYGPGDSFGENFCKENQPKENSMMVVSSRSIHLLTLSRENYNQIISRLNEETHVKTKFFDKLFPGYNEHYIQAFSDFFIQKHFKTAEIIFSQNDTSRELYLMSTGEITLMKDIDLNQTVAPSLNNLISASIKSTRKAELPIVSVINGQFFGEEAILEQKARQYTAIASSGDVVVYYLKDYLLPKIERNFSPFLVELNKQAITRSAWRQQRTNELVQKHQLAYSLFSLAPMPLSSQRNFHSTTNSPSSTIQKEPQTLNKKLFNRPRDLSLDNSTTTLKNSFVEDTVLIEDNITPKQHEIYRTKFSRRLKGIVKSTIDHKALPRSHNRQSSTEISPQQEMREFNVRKQLEEIETGKANLSKFFVSQKFSPDKTKDTSRLPYVRARQSNNNSLVEPSKAISIQQRVLSPVLIKIKHLNGNEASKHLKGDNSHEDEQKRRARFNKASIHSFEKFPQNTFEKKKRLESLLRSLNCGPNRSQTCHKIEKSM